MVQTIKETSCVGILNTVHKWTSFLILLKYDAPVLNFSEHTPEPLVTERQ